MNYWDPEGRFPVIVIPLLCVAADYLIQGVSNLLTKENESFADAFFYDIDVTSLLAAAVTGSSSRVLKAAALIIDSAVDISIKEGYSTNDLSTTTTGVITGAISNSTSKAISKEVTSKIVTAEKEAAEAAYYSQKRANIAANSNSSRTKKIAEQAKIKAEATQMTVKKTVFWGNIKRSLTIPIQTTAKSVTEIVKDNDENEDKKEHK